MAVNNRDQQAKATKRATRRINAATDDIRRMRQNLEAPRPNAYDARRAQSRQMMDSLMGTYEAMPGGNNTLGTLPTQATAPPRPPKRTFLPPLEPDPTPARVGRDPKTGKHRNVIGTSLDSIPDPGRFKAARAERDKRKELARQRQFARAQMRRGEMFNADGTADLAGSMAAQLMRTRPDLAAGLAAQRDVGQFNREMLQADVNQRAAQNQMARRQLGMEDEQRQFQNELTRDQFRADRQDKMAALTMAQEEADRRYESQQITDEQHAAQTEAIRQQIEQNQTEFDRREALMSSFETPREAAEFEAQLNAGITPANRGTEPSMGSRIEALQRFNEFDPEIKQSILTDRMSALEEAGSPEEARRIFNEVPIPESYLQEQYRAMKNHPNWVMPMSPAEKEQRKRRESRIRALMAAGGIEPPAALEGHYDNPALFDWFPQ